MTVSETATWIAAFAAVGTLLGVIVAIIRLASELKPNHGSSLRDAVDRIEQHAAANAQRETEHYAETIDKVNDLKASVQQVEFDQQDLKSLIEYYHPA